MIEIVVEGPEAELIEKIKRARGKDEEVVKVVKERKMYVSKDEELRVEIIQLHYDVLVAGYCRRWKMTELVARGYKEYWKICRWI